MVSQVPANPVTECFHRFFCLFFSFNSAERSEALEKKMCVRMFLSAAERSEAVEKKVPLEKIPKSTDFFFPIFSSCSQTNLVVPYHMSFFFFSFVGCDFEHLLQSKQLQFQKSQTLTLPYQTARQACPRTHLLPLAIRRNH